MSKLLTAAALAIALSGCGSSGVSTSSTASPQQTDNSQRDVSYVRAVNRIMAPFSKRPANLTDYAGAARKLHVAIGQLDKLDPPAQFASIQKRLVSGLRAQAALAPRFARATAQHDSVELSNLEGRLVAAAGTIRTAMRDMLTAYNQCQRGSFQTC